MTGPSPTVRPRETGPRRRKKEAQVDARQAEIRTGAGAHVILLDNWHEQARDDVPVLIDVQGQHRLETHVVGGALLVGA